MFGPTTGAERRTWQRRALAVLADLLAEDLPPMRWMVTPVGDLAGRVVARDPDGQRVAFETWVAFLGAEPWPERRGAGYSHLHAVVDRYREVRISLTADVLHDDECL